MHLLQGYLGAEQALSLIIEYSYRVKCYTDNLTLSFNFKNTNTLNTPQIEPKRPELKTSPLKQDISNKIRLTSNIIDTEKC